MFYFDSYMINNEVKGLRWCAQLNFKQSVFTRQHMRLSH